MKKLLTLILAGATLPALAKINFDYETDPLPLIKFTSLVPSTRLFRNDTENLGLRILEQCFEAGTERLNKQKFQDSLASYGASLEMSLGNEYADVSITFPLNAGKIPPGLIALTKEAWEKPRVTTETFERARKLLRANYLSTLERDGSLLSMGLQKILATSLFGLKPYSVQTFDRVTLDVVEDLKKTFYRNDEIWVGVIGPAELKKELEAAAQTIFAGAGEVREGVMQTRLHTGYEPEQNGKLAPTFMLIDKKDLAQTYYGFARVNQHKTSPQTELIDNFTNYVLTGSSLDSLYFRRIRGDKGLAYQVGNLMETYYDYPVVSLFANPQRSKQAEAFEVMSQLLKETFDEGKIISSVLDTSWKGRLTSFKNSERQIGATPEGRLGRRKNVVIGELSYNLYKRPIDDWNVSKSESARRLGSFNKGASLLMGAIGDASEVEPLVKKYFPQLKLIKLSYKDVITEGWLQH